MTHASEHRRSTVGSASVIPDERLTPLMHGFVASVALCCCTTHAIAQQEVGKITASDAEPGDFFGTSAAISDDTIVVGAPKEDEFEADSGAIYIFERADDDVWLEVVKMKASLIHESAEFGSSVDIDGDTIVVGARFDDVTTGSAYVIRREDGSKDNWMHVRKLTASDAHIFDQFGHAVAIDGDTIAVGAPAEHWEVTSFVGAVYIFERNPKEEDTWAQVTKITPNVITGGGLFGNTVDLSGDLLIVGAPSNDSAARNAGAAYIYQRDPDGSGDWEELAFLTANDAATGDEFGFRVAFDGNLAAVGAWRDDGDGSDFGSVYIFTGPDGWIQATRITAVDGAENDMFGSAVALSGSSLLVGASLDDDAGDASGSVYLYHRVPGGADDWTEITKFTASDAQPGDEYGQWVAIDDEFGVVGAFHNDDAGPDSGSAYVLCNLAGCPADLNIDDNVGFPDLLLLLTDLASPDALCSSFCTTDLDGDDDIDFADLLLLFDAWGPCDSCPSFLPLNHEAENGID